ncbi:hypothetical protein [Actinomadura sp. 6K520]|uniref:hypothetical protein n=1 Tax=Actinomadura sp. 6K520 TaxID=2530364 RepID=UPI00104A06D7|nr:hypothetical protein [Actinomadura sp. 6K520]TDE22752.1 hypothetical protein E1289_29725 [Actinomadura sp. 6K520]
MRLSSDLPPAGFTRAEPRPPGRPRRFPPRVLAAVALGAGLALAAGYGAIAAPARTVPPGADTASPAPRSVPPPSAPPRSAAASPSGRAVPGPGEVASAGRPVTREKPSRRGRAVPSRTHRPRTPRPTQVPRPRSARPARPAVPPWIAAECRRRYPDDPRRRAVCAAVLTRAFGG